MAELASASAGSDRGIGSSVQSDTQAARVGGSMADSVAVGGDNPLDLTDYGIQANLDGQYLSNMESEEEEI